MMDWCHVTFFSASGAMAALRQVSAGCGIALRLRPEWVEPARRSLEKAGLEAQFYAVFGTGEALRCERL